MIEGQLEPPPDSEQGLRVLLRLAVMAQRNHDAKVAKYQAEHPEHDPACGILTRDAVYLAAVTPRLARAGITRQHIQDLADGKQPARIRGPGGEPLHLPSGGPERADAGPAAVAEQPAQ